MREPDREQPVRLDLSDIVVPEGGPAPGYANNVFVTHTAWEFSLVFALLDIMPTPEGAAPRYANRLVTKVNVSPHLVKGIIRALQTNVERYEEHYGLKLPERVGQQDEVHEK